MCTSSSSPHYMKAPAVAAAFEEWGGGTHEVSL